MSNTYGFRCIRAWIIKPIFFKRLFFILMAGFHLDIDSRDGKILILRNKGWRGCNRVGQHAVGIGVWGHPHPGF